MAPRAQILPARQNGASTGGSPEARGGGDHAGSVFRDAATDRAERIRRVHGAGACASAAAGADRAEAMAMARLNGYDAVIVGAGFAGLSAAVRLTRAGARVLVLEARA